MKKLLLTIVAIIFIALISAGAYFMISPTAQTDITNKIMGLLPSSDKVIPSDNLDIAINTNPDSNIGLIISSPTKEGLVTFTKELNGTEYVDSIVLQSADNKSGTITLDEDGLPKNFQFEGSTISYSNYSENTVDVTITPPTGEVQNLVKTPLNLPEELASIRKSILFSTAHAANPYQYASPPTSGASKSDNTDGIYYIQTTTLAANVVFCGLAIATLFTSLGLSSPWAFVSCGTLGARVITRTVDMGPCNDTLLSKSACAKEGIRRLYANGVLLSGYIKDAKSDAPVNGGIIDITKKNGIAYDQYIADSNGLYGGFNLIEKGSYKFKVNADGFIERIFIVAVTSDRIKIVDDATTEITLDENYHPNRNAHGFSIGLQSINAFRGQVLNKKTGEPIEGITLEVAESYFGKGKVILSTKTDKEGGYTFTLPKGELEYESIGIFIEDEKYLDSNTNLQYTATLEINDPDYSILIYNDEKKDTIQFDGIIELTLRGRFDGKWVGKAVSSIIETEEAFCTSADITFFVKLNKIEGHAFINYDYGLTVNGLVDDEGLISGGFASGSENIANYNGQLKEDGTGLGGWTDQYGCYGTYSLIKERD